MSLVMHHPLSHTSINTKNPDLLFYSLPSGQDVCLKTCPWPGPLGGRPKAALAALAGLDRGSHNRPSSLIPVTPPFSLRP